MQQGTSSDSAVHQPRARTARGGTRAPAPEAAAAGAAPEPPEAEGNEAVEPRPERAERPAEWRGGSPVSARLGVALADTRPLAAGALTSSAARAAPQAAVTAIHELPDAGLRCYLRSRGRSCSLGCATGVAAAGPGGGSARAVPRRPAPSAGSSPLHRSARPLPLASSAPPVAQVETVPPHHTHRSSQVPPHRCHSRLSSPALSGLIQPLRPAAPLRPRPSAPVHPPPVTPSWSFAPPPQGPVLL